jgi:hypothetical protein
MKALTAVRSRPFYVALSLLIGLIALAGFWPTYYGLLLDGSLAKALRVHIHAVLFTGWLLLFLTQAMFAATGKLAWHKRLGNFGIGYAILLIPIGLYNAIERAIVQSRGFYRELLDMLFFAIFFGAAIAYRRKPQLHKRLMIVASTMLLVAPASRMWFLAEMEPGSPTRLLAIFSVLVLPVVLAIGYDLVKGQRLHPIYIAGVFAFLVRVFSPAYVDRTDIWPDIERSVLAFVGGR